MLRTPCYLVGLSACLGALAVGACAGAMGLQAQDRADVELNTRDVGSHETGIGDLVADAIRSQAHADAAIISASEFTDATIKAGPFTPADVTHALTYTGDEIVVMRLTGDQITRALQHGLYLYPGNNSGFLQVSGMTVTFNPNADKEQHVLSVRVGDAPLESGKTYHIAMPAPLANGALAYFKIWKKSEIERSTGKTLEAAVTAYLVEHRTVGKGEERLVARAK
jgi:2',3'-cyclic-nucleotide 2'-phosphodiesterase (5'-nucleotidase family)